MATPRTAVLATAMISTGPLSTTGGALAATSSNGHGTADAESCHNPTAAAN
jgi:hypothetical protein